MLRPMIVLQYLPYQTATNNAPAIKAALRRSGVSELKAKDRTLLVVANIGTDAAVATERARNAALLLDEMGEESPRLYVRKSVAADKTDSVEIFGVPGELWSDNTYERLISSETMYVKALGGILQAKVARTGLDQVFEREIDVEAGNLLVQLRRVLRSVGWGVDVYRVPHASVNAMTMAVSINESGIASASEAMAIARQIVSMSSHNVTIKSNTRDRVIEIYGATE